MRSFEEYYDGDWVVYKKSGHPWDMMFFQAYKSIYTHDAFRLKYGRREVVADISEIQLLVDYNKERSYEDINSNLQRRTESDEFSELDLYDPTDIQD